MGADYLWEGGQSTNSDGVRDNPAAAAHSYANPAHGSVIGLAVRVRHRMNRT